MITPDLVVHAGLPYCGARMLHVALSRLQPQLRAHGVAYVAWADGALETIATERERACTAGRTWRTTLVCAPTLALDHDLCADGAAQRLDEVADVARADCVRVVLHVQRQDRLLELAYLHRLHAGAHHAFGAQFPDPAAAVPDYAELVRRLGAVPAVADVVVAPAEHGVHAPAEFVDGFLDTVDLRGQLAIRGPLKPYRTYSRQGVALALAMNPLLETERERVRVHRMLIGTFEAADDADARVLPDDERATILAAYRDANVAFFRQYLPDLPEDGYADDAATAALVSAASARPPGSSAPSCAGRRCSGRGWRDRLTATAGRGPGRRA